MALIFDLVLLELGPGEVDDLVGEQGEQCAFCYRAGKGFVKVTLFRACRVRIGDKYGREFCTVADWDRCDEYLLDNRRGVREGVDDDDRDEATSLLERRAALEIILFMWLSLSIIASME